MHILRDVLEQAQNDGKAVAHFNVSDLVLLRAVFSAAQELKAPVIVGASGGEREFIGTRQLAAVVQSLRAEFDHPVPEFRSHSFIVGRPGSSQGRV